MRTQGIISDPEPLTPPNEIKPVTPPKSDWEKLGKSAHYPTVDAYINQRIMFYQRYLPNGEPIENLTPEARDIAWGQALCVIKEFEALQKTINLQSGK